MIKIEMQSESGTSDRTAFVKVYENGRLIAHIRAIVMDKSGIDAGVYPCVEFTTVPVLVSPIIVGVNT